MLHSLTVGIIRAFFRVAGFVLVASGLASVLAWWLAGVFSAAGPEVQGLGRVARNIALIHVVYGAGALYLLNRRHEVPPPDRRAAGETADRPLWLLVLGLFLIILPVVLVIEMQPLVAFWTETHRSLSAPGFYEEQLTSPDLAPLAFMALAGILTVPITTTIAAVTLGLSSALLFVLWLWRSSFFPRAFAICAVFQLAWLLSAASAGSQNILDMIDAQMASSVQGSSMNEQMARNLADFKRWKGVYDQAMTGVPMRLTAAFGGFLIWLPLLMTGNQTARIFTRDVAWGRVFTPASPWIISTPGAVQTSSAVFSRIHFEGRDYESPQMMPADVRQRYERVVSRLGADADGDGIPDAVQTGRATMTTTVHFMHNGRLYTSVDEMPPEVRQAYEKVVRLL